MAKSPSQAEETGLEPMAGIRSRFSDAGAIGSLPWLKQGACRQTLTLRSLSPVSAPGSLPELAVWMSALSCFPAGCCWEFGFILNQIRLCSFCMRSLEGVSVPDQGLTEGAVEHQHAHSLFFLRSSSLRCCIIHKRNSSECHLINRLPLSQQKTHLQPFRLGTAVSPGSMVGLAHTG